MIYYKQIDGGKITRIGTTYRNTMIGTEITKEEYDTLLKKIKDDAENRRKTIYSYVSRIKAGTITILDVPEEYKEEVGFSINPVEPKPYTKEQYDAVIESLITEGVL